jgi:hypothetical protein
VKNIKEQVLLFEANGAIGVGIMPWSRFIGKNHYKLQEMYGIDYVEWCFGSYMWRGTSSSMKRLRSLSSRIWDGNTNFHLRLIYYTGTRGWRMRINRISVVR